jgi:hypothetical protein
MPDYNRDLGILSTYSLTLPHPNFISAHFRIFLFSPHFFLRIGASWVFVILYVKAIQITSGLQGTYRVFNLKVDR